MGFQVFSLGGLDLRHTSGAYIVPDTVDEWDPNWEETFAVNCGSQGGARLVKSTLRETARRLAVICLGTTVTEAKANRLAIEAVLSTARANRDVPTVTYVEQDTTETEPDSWYVIGGKLTPSSSIPGLGRIVGVVNGKRVACCLLNLALTKT